MKGFNDSFDKKDNSKKYKGVELSAYQWGWNDSIVGDDVSSVDERPWKDTLKLIKGK